MIEFALCFIAPSLVSWLFIQRWSPAPWSWPALVLSVPLAGGLGLGLSSCLAFLWLYGAGRMSPGFLLLELVLYGSLGVLAMRRAKPAPLEPPKPDRLTLYALALLGLVGLCTVLYFFGNAIQRPCGVWDALAIWNYRARFLLRADTDWQQAFSPPANHPDYPLLLPLSVFQLWRCWESESPWFGVLLSACFAFGTVMVLGAALALIRGTIQGILGALLLLAAHHYFTIATYQYADVPLSFYMLATVVCCCIPLYFPSERREFSMIAGAFAGLAAWTKNEGILFLLVVFAVHLGFLAVTRTRQQLRRLIAMLVGVVPIIVVLALFKSIVPLTGLVSEQAAQSPWTKLADPARYSLIVQSFGEMARRFGIWTWTVPALFGLLMWRARDEKLREPVRMTACILGLMLLGEGLVYVLTPYDLAWHTQTSMDRLMAQLLPTAYFLVFLGVASPNEVLAAAEQPTSGKRKRDRRQA